jgi:two-component system cell cycle response regulator
MPKSVLVIDPVAVNRIRLATVLEAGHYTVNAVATAADAAMLAVEPDIVVLGVAGEAPRPLISTVLASGPWSDVPILALESDPTPFRRLSVLRAGARDVLSASSPDAFLLARVRGLIREGEAERECARRRMTAASFGFSDSAADFDSAARVLTVDSHGIPPALSSMLGAALGRVSGSISEDDALRDDVSAGGVAAYVVVSGPRTDVIDRLLPELRDRSHSRHCPVLVIHPADRPDIATHALDLGASDLAAETATGEEFNLRIEWMLARKRQRDLLRRSDEQSYRMAMTDPLTGLYNRRYADAYLGDLILHAGEAGRGFVVLLLDLDHFKEVNDRHGHASGDKVLSEVSFRLRDNLRACDLISRHGGEEFLVVLPDTTLAVAARTAERLRASVADAPVALGNGASVSVTASVGVAAGQVTGRMRVKRTGTFDVAEAETTALHRVMESADAALYRAKDFGRNRVEISAGIA